MTGIQVLDLPPLAWLGAFFTTVAIAGVLVHHIDTLYRDKSDLYHELIHDQLTGAFSRTYFELRLAEAMQRSARNPGCDAYVVVLDVDDFKTVNDRTGHPAGDQVLRGVVAVLKESVRETDVVARLGGDEFALLLLDVGTDEQVESVIARVQDLLARSIVVHRGVEITVTCSFGITRLASAACQTCAAADVITAADDAMYDAKKAGKNTIRARHIEDAAKAPGT
jgi:diguanylate cyclase (GGDEF)-like protein